jgi:hypothetical protein
MTGPTPIHPIPHHLLVLLPAGLLQWWPGNLSYRDFLADLAGIALAAAGILLYHHTAAGAGTSSTASALAGLASSPKLPGQRQPGYRPVPTDIEMGAASTQSLQ